MVKTEVFDIKIDDLGVDSCNIRSGDWNYDEELVNSIKDNGVLEPLLIRKIDLDAGFQYGIISGSRRYHASMEAGLDTVPCIIKNVDDVTALGISIMENRHRSDIPGWMYAEKIRKMNDLINHGTTTTKKVKMIMAKTGLSQRIVYDYLSITELPEETRELMKEPEKRSEKIKEYIKVTAPGAVDRPLSKDKATKIATRLKEFSDEKKFEVGRYISGLKEETAFDVIEKVRVHPEQPLTEIKKMVEGIPKSVTWTAQFEWGPNVIDAIDKACMKKNVDRKNLVNRYVEDGLKRDGFLD